MFSGRRQFILGIAAVWLVAAFTCGAMAQEPASAPAPVAASSSKPDESDETSMIVKRLTAENEQLRARVAELEKSLQRRSTRELLIVEEQRAENLRTQMITLGEKEAELMSNLDRVNEQLRPENIEHLQVMGSLHPEAVRESTRRRLTGEQKRLQSQLELLQQSRNRLQSSLSVADMLILNLRVKVLTP